MYAATFALKIFRMMMIFVADFHFKIKQLNVVNVFLNVFNDEKIYCHMSNEYKNFKKILKLLRALYEQRKSSLLWLRILIDKCIEFELNSIFDEFCLFSNDNEILMFFYVNDIVFAFTTSRKKDAENLIRRLKDIFDMRNLNSLNFFLDVRILQKLDTIWLIQNFYMNKLIKNYVIVDSSLRWWYDSSQYTVCEVYCWMMIQDFIAIWCVIYIDAWVTWLTLI